MSFLVTHLGLGLASQTAVASNTAPSRSVLPRVVVTVMALDPRGLATLQTVDGARDEVVTSTG